MPEDLDTYLHSIEDYVLVEDKIVTYKWISKALKVHTNTAKQLLQAFALKEEFNKKLLVTYLITGEEKDYPGLKFYLVKEEDVDKVKETLDKVISEHVYSVQRGSIFNELDLYNADNAFDLNEEDKRFSSIRKNEDIVKRNKESSEGSIATSFNIKSSNNAQNKISQEKVNNKIPTEIYLENKSASKENEKPEIEKCLSPTKKSNTSATLNNKKSPKKSKNAVSKGPTIGTFFSKQATNAANQPKKESFGNKEKDENETNRNIKVEAKEEESTKLPSNVYVTPQNKIKVNNKKRKKRSKENELSNKRRKRIIVASDSESSASEMEIEEERELSPEPEPVKVLEESDEEIIPPTPVEKGRKRIQKQVDETYAVDDGFILTKKFSVLVSCSDDEATTVNKTNKETDPSNNKNVIINKDSDNHLNDNNKLENGKKTSKKQKSPKKPPSSKQQRKQPSITNFFRKM